MGNVLKLIDLTHPITAEMPTWDDNSKFKLEVASDYIDFDTEDKFKTNIIHSPASMGTHIDAPAHMFPGSRTVDQLHLAELSADCIVLDVSADADENYVIMPEVLQKYEAEHGEIPAATFILFYTGWSKYWVDPKKYRNDYKFPSLHSLTAEALIFRGVAGVGIDTLSFDTGASGFPAHRVLLGKDRYLIENIANAHLLPLVGAKIIALPMNIVGATEAPVRLIALI